jgi:transcriptional regulator with XRE-family HTH domain
MTRHVRAELAASRRPPGRYSRLMTTTRTRENLGPALDNLNLGEALRKLRQERALSLRELSAMTGHGITAAGIGRIELGERTANWKTLRMLAGALGIEFHIDAEGVSLINGHKARRPMAKAKRQVGARRSGGRRTRSSERGRR